MSGPAIVIDHLSVAYGGTIVVHDLCLEIGAGEIFGFIGPNGAGKTTTIRTMASLLSPSSGRVEICGVDVELEPERAVRQLGYMPDHAGVYERLTVREYLEFFAEASRVSDPRSLDAIFELVGISSLSDKLVAALSKGMRQRLQLGRILLHDPSVLILDEPASDLDPRARIEMRDLLLELRGLGKTIFLSSHILTELSDVCTSVGIIERGKLLTSGPIGEIAASLRDQRQEPGVSGVPPALPLHGELPPPGQSDTGSSTDVAPPELTPGGEVVPRATQRRLKLRVLGRAENIVPLLVACPPIKSIDTVHGSTLTARYVGDERFVADLVHYLVSHGIGIVSVEPERSELELLFLEVTKGEVQ